MVFLYKMLSRCNSDDKQKIVNFKGIVKVLINWLGKKPSLNKGQFQTHDKSSNKNVLELLH